MAQTTAKKAKTPAAGTRKPAKKSTGAAKKSTGAAKKSTSAPQKTAVDRTADLSEEVLKSVEAGQRAAIEAVRKFVDTVDEALPAIGERPSRREAVIDAAMEMADKLVATQYHFLRSVVRSADRSLDKPGDAKK